ncbi:hypothetical protein CICLE_v10006351mg [Citrus x clementina]|uniref:Uncharacterized protein n=1 Tax=Citrus clementina TaxID=85681 RepID=V4S0C1_CITCL|nr:hypothetical protein CICLE_v10006351mg [Citrus x clementina]
MCGLQTHHSVLYSPSLTTQLLSLFCLCSLTLLVGFGVSCGLSLAQIRRHCSLNKVISRSAIALFSEMVAKGFKFHNVCN